MPSYKNFYEEIKGSISGYSGGIPPKNSAGELSREFMRDATSSTDSIIPAP